MSKIYSEKMKAKSPTTKDIALLQQLHQEGQLKLQPEFQRESVWPRVAKSYLIDTILNEKPIPLFFFQRSTSAQTGRPEYAVIDGQQRLRAIFGFMNDEFSLSEVSPDSRAKKFKGKKFSQLPSDFQQLIYNYDLVIQELSGYSEKDIRDIFARMNKYVVRLSKQELRHAKSHGKFKELVEKIGKWPFWKNQKVFTDVQIKRMRPDEFSAELIILLAEGPQNKKTAVDLYYGQYQNNFSEGAALRARLDEYLKWIDQTFEDFSKTRFKNSNELYSLIGALEQVSKSGKRLAQINSKNAEKALLKFETQTKEKEPKGKAAEYLASTSKHADDLSPRNRRIEIIIDILKQ